MQRRVAALDKRYSADLDLDVPGFADVVDLAAWAHSEWVRIHPFVNGNGRTARYLANFIFTRYGIGPVVRVRPRPGGDYEAAAADSMNGSHAATVNVFIKMIADQSSRVPARLPLHAALGRRSLERPSHGPKEG